jgi:hypothetical protein
MASNMSPCLAVKSIVFSERNVPFVTPFRFGLVTVNEAQQLFAHVEIEIAGRRSGGASAELMVPKWFNKDPKLSADESVDQLRKSAAIARELYLTSAAPNTAFALHAACIAAQVSACAEARIPPLAAAFGIAEIDKAVLDALLRAVGTDFFSGMRGNIAGIDSRLTPDLSSSAIIQFLASRDPSTRVAVRYTIGILDSIDSVRAAAAKGYRYYKIKLSGDPANDRERLIDLAEALGGVDYRATADANEQYQSLADLEAVIELITRDPRLASFAERLLYIEQPFARENTWNVDVRALCDEIAFIIDEADDDYDAFPRAKVLGYRGVSSKSCKGLYKSLLNGVRAAEWGGKYFISAEDLTCQAGLALQQDTALVALHGLTHAERNGHRYVNGFAGTPAAEAQAFLAGHPDLYRQSGGRVHLAVEDGAILTHSLSAKGFASAVRPDQVGPRANPDHHIQR